MTPPQQFTANFNAKFAFGPHGWPKVHPNHLSARKRRWLDGLCAVLFNGADKGRANHDGESKIGRLTVERDFLETSPTPRLGMRIRTAPMKTILRD